MSKLARDFEPLYERWSSDIFAFAREGMNFDYHFQQEWLFRLVQNESILPIERRKKRIAVKSGKGPGKTAATVIVALWRCLRYEDSLCIVTAPSMRQCKQWIDEAKRLLKNAHPFLQKFIRCYDTRIEIGGRKLWGVKTATATRPENLQGIHEKRLTFIADEASGIATKLMQAIKDTLSNPDALFVAIGNPNTVECEFHNFFTVDRQFWHTLTYNAEETAMKRPDVVSPSRNRVLLMECDGNRDDPRYRVGVRGEFPLSETNTIFDLAQLERCTRTSLVGCAGITEVLSVNKAIGIDYAAFGHDESVVARRAGLAIVKFKVFHGSDPREVTDWAFREQADNGWKNKDCLYVPDVGGLGGGIRHAFPEAGKLWIPFHTQGRPSDSQYEDKMTEAWFLLRSLVQAGIVHLPKDQRLLSQLATRQYYLTRKGKLKVETKDEWKKRTDRKESPDRADAVVMAFYCPAGANGFKSMVFDRRKKTVGTSARRER